MEIKVGDKIYFEQYSRISSVEEVLKITPKGMIKTRRHNLRADGGNWLKVLGQGRWYSTSARLETPELAQRWREQQATAWLSKNYQRIKPEDIEPLMEKYPEAS